MNLQNEQKKRKALNCKLSGSCLEALFAVNGEGWTDTMVLVLFVLIV